SRFSLLIDAKLGESKTTHGGRRDRGEHLLTMQPPRRSQTDRDPGEPCVHPPPLLARRHPRLVLTPTRVYPAPPLRCVAVSVDALVRFRRRMDELGITQYRAVATSAVRDSANGTDLIARTRRAAGIALEVIDGTEEAELVVRAVRARVPMGREPWLLVDIGGGSVEVTLADARRTLKTASYPLGAVRLLEHYDAGDAAGARRVIEAQVDAIPLPDEAGRAVGGFVATGGNADALADLLELEPDDGATARLSLELLCETIERLAAASIEERLSWG